MEWGSAPSGKGNRVVVFKVFNGGRVSQKRLFVSGLLPHREVLSYKILREKTQFGGNRGECRSLI